MPKKYPLNNGGKIILVFIGLFAALIFASVFSRKGTAGGGGIPLPLPAPASASKQKSINIPISPNSGRDSDKNGLNLSAGANSGSAGNGNANTQGRTSNSNQNGNNTASNTARSAQNKQKASKNKSDAAQMLQTATVVRVLPATLDTISNSIAVLGDVIVTKQVSLYPQIAGKITSLTVRVGDIIEKNQIVAYIDPSRPGEVFSASPVRSTISGAVLQSPFSAGEMVTSQSTIYVIGDTTSLAIESYIPERFSSEIRKGLNASIYFDSIDNETFTGIINEVSPVIDPASRTLKIRLRLNKNDPRLRAGMFATISIVIKTHENTLTVPRDALINTYGKWIVFIVDDNAIARRREVIPGIENENIVEIVSGIKAGELIVIAGQNFLSNNEPVRITN
ncbi:MAG: efflux RND transporter periplasmic adaptor subunit [Spirochaetaceae bacterium]|jgi:multidrug efflux pump subunit AcrA (membrane-fusion protein)|nr:efflux RND transporter periplasmic adaptor subunit [Spirochaetaceae bacterium]